MKNMEEATYVLGIKIDRDKSRWFLGQSQKVYINKVLKRCDMKYCKPGKAPVIKGDVLRKSQPKNDVLAEIFKEYASVLGSIVYAMVFLKPDIGFIARMLGRYQQNPSWIQWQTVNKVLCYLKRTRDFMLA